MKFLFTGNFQPDYNRTDIIRVGLKKIGHQVVDFPFKKKSKAVAQQLHELSRVVDLVYMPSFTHKEVGFVKKTIPDKKIIFDPLISRYLTKVYDYQTLSPYGLGALINYYIDKWSMQAADFVVTDTEAHRNYFHSHFSIPLDKMSVLYIGNNFEEYFPENPLTLNKKFRVGFYGGFIPLQGVMVILESARRLSGHKDIEFELIGTGFEYAKAQAFVKEHDLTNVSMPGWIKNPALRERINQFDVALGIFGLTEKSSLVIPNKIYHYVACARPVITKDSTALREIFMDQEDMMMIAPNADALCNAIQKLKGLPEQARGMGLRAHALLKEKYSESHVAQKLIDIANSLR